MSAQEPSRSAFACSASSLRWAFGQTAALAVCRFRAAPNTATGGGRGWGDHADQILCQRLFGGCEDQILSQWQPVPLAKPFGPSDFRNSCRLHTNSMKADGTSRILILVTGHPLLKELRHLLFTLTLGLFFREFQSFGSKFQPTTKQNHRNLRPFGTTGLPQIRSTGGGPNQIVSTQGLDKVQARSLDEAWPRVCRPPVGFLLGFFRVFHKKKELEEAAMRSAKSFSRFVKMDVEGFETEVLKGARQTLRRADYLFIEVWPEAQEKQNCTPGDFLGELEDFPHAYHVDFDLRSTEIQLQALNLSGWSKSWSEKSRFMPHGFCRGTFLTCGRCF